LLGRQQFIDVLRALNLTQVEHGNVGGVHG
jgi:hypothetical protein